MLWPEIHFAEDGSATLSATASTFKRHIKLQRCSVTNSWRAVEVGCQAHPRELCYRADVLNQSSAQHTGFATFIRPCVGPFLQWAMLL